MRKSFNEYVAERKKVQKIDDICWNLAVQLNRLNIHTEGFMRWFIEQDRRTFGNDDLHQLLVEEGGFMNMLNAGWQGLKQGFGTGAKWGAGAGALGGTLAMPGAGTIAGAGLGGTFGGLGGALVGGVRGMWNQYNNPQTAAAIQAQPLIQNITQSFEKIKKIYGQHQNGQQIAAQLDQTAKFLQQLEAPAQQAQPQQGQGQKQKQPPGRPAVPPPVPRQPPRRPAAPPPEDPMNDFEIGQ